MTVEGQILQKRGIMSREQKTAVNRRKNGYLLETKCPVVIFQSLLIRLLSVQSHSLQRKKGLKLTETKFIVILWELMPARACGLGQLKNGVAQCPLPMLHEISVQRHMVSYAISPLSS